MEGVALYDGLGTAAEQYATGAVFADIAVTDEHGGVFVASSDDVALFQSFRRGLCEGDHELAVVDGIGRRYLGVGVCHEASWVDKLYLHAPLEVAETVLVDVHQFHHYAVVGQDVGNAEVDAVDVGGVVGLVGKVAVGHPDASRTVGEVCGVGSEAEDAVLARCVAYYEAVERYIVAALGYDAHATCVIHGHVVDGEIA